MEAALIGSETVRSQNFWGEVVWSVGNFNKFCNLRPKIDFFGGKFKECLPFDNHICFVKFDAELHL